jgi:methylated-DNA-[protein]-cysteine S-methyltransferase
VKECTATADDKTSRKQTNNIVFYSEIADNIQKPASVRAVGAAIGANPVLIVVPCHRVIGKNGTLTGYRGSLEMKKKLLQLESESSLMEGRLLHG